MSIILELKYEFITIVAHSDSDDFYQAMLESTVDVVRRNGITPEDFVDEEEYDQFIENLMDQADRSVSLQFIPTPKLVGLVGDLTDKIKEKKKNV
jgi:hypothetical protein